MRWEARGTDKEIVPSGHYVLGRVEAFCGSQCRPIQSAELQLLRVNDELSGVL